MKKISIGGIIILILLFIIRIISKKILTCLNDNKINKVNKYIKTNKSNKSNKVNKVNKVNKYNKYNKVNKHLGILSSINNININTKFKKSNCLYKNTVLVSANNNKFTNKPCNQSNNNSNKEKLLIKPYHKIHPDSDNIIKLLKNNLTPRLSGQYYYISAIKSIYNIPSPNLTDKYVVGIISFGGSLYGTIDPITGLLSSDISNNAINDIYKYWDRIGIPSNNLPTVVVKFLNGAKDITNDPTILDKTKDDIYKATSENTLDVEIIGGCCPSSNLIIILYIGPNTYTQFTTTLRYILNTPVNIQGTNYIPNCVSISWGIAESKIGSNNMNSINLAMGNLISAGINICVASGDFGSSDGLPGLNVDFPSSSPNCTAVGGTNLYCPSINNNYYSYTNTGTTEVAWTGSGGGISSYFFKPSYQSSINSTYRSTPDIALIADPTNGIIILLNNSYYIFGGTSCSAPIFAGFLAATNTKIFVNSILYSNTNWFNDITSGNNGFYNAISGYDNCTGFGSINGTLLAPIINSGIYITLNQINSLTLYIGNTFSANATVYPSTISQLVTWSSSNSNIAIVSSSGVVTAISIGTVNIIATLSSNLSIINSFIVNIIQTSPTSITLTSSPAITTLYTTYPDNTTQITSVVNPSGASQLVTWSSSNSFIATVSNSGLVTAVSIGTVTIIATSNALTTISNSTTFTIIQHIPTSITLTSLTTKLYTTSPNNTTQITSVVNPSGASQLVTWSSSNSSIATVSNSGLVTAKSNGSVTITAKSTILTTILKTLLLKIYKHSIIVNPLTKKIVISKSSTSQSFSIKAIIGSTENGNIVAWSSSNNKYVSIGNPTISSNISTVNVTCYKAGIGKKVTITAKINKNIISKCVITISN